MHPTSASRFALRVLQIGAIAIVLVALPYKAFELDRFFVPKELVLHLAAFSAALALVAARRRLSLTRLDVLILVFLLVSTVSAALATNWWLAGRALAISISGAVVFWASRTLRDEGMGRALVCTFAAATALGAVTALLQAYGVETEYFSLNRSPGGTFGNRNFMAHLAAIGTPALILCALTARRIAAFGLGAMALAVTSAGLVLSRSRAAWLALAAALTLMALAAWLTRSRWRDARLRRRGVALAIVVAAGVAGAITLPNSLDWKSDSPYLESMRGVVNYKKGSGRGRLVQYTNSLDMAVDRPLTGVGPGNWPVIYPRYASDGDPSFDSEGMTANPWPSSDWMAFLAERGAIAFGALVLVLLFLGLNAVRQLREARTEEQLAAGVALGGTVVAVAVVGAFDAVLLLAAPTLIVWGLFGALSEPARRGPALTRGVHQWVPAMVFALGVLAAGRTLLQAVSMGLASPASRTSRLETAALLDPGSYRVHVRLAAQYLDRGRCDRAIPHARAARELFPNAPQPRQYLRACGVRTPRRT